MEVLWRTFKAWQTVQSAHHGLYSIHRMQALQSYIDTKFGAARFITLLAAAPMPCVVTIVLMDVVPLEPPIHGINANGTFWVRSAITVVVFTLSYVQQAASMVPMLRLSWKHIIGMTVVATAGAQATHYMLSLAVGFPVPFSILLQAPVWFALMWTYFAMVKLRHIHSCPKAWSCLVDFLSISSLSMSQLVIYPLCSHIFAISSPVTQIALSLLLYFVKNVYRFAIGHFVREQPDRKAQIVTFHAEIAHSLFMTFSLQRANSTSTLAALLIVDALRSTLTLYDVHIRIQRLNGLERIIRKTAPETEKPMSAIIRTNSIVTRCRLESKLTTSNILRVLSARNINRIYPRWPTRHDIVAQAHSNVLVSGPTRAEVAGMTRIIPIATTITNTTLSKVANKVGPQQPTRAEADYVEETLQLLRLTEFAILSELIEFLVPVIYSKCFSFSIFFLLFQSLIISNAALYVAAAANLPNRNYFPQLAGVNVTTLPHMLLKMIAYGVLELVSLLVLDLMLRRRLRFSPTAQLALALENDLKAVQADLMIWVVYTVQVTLVHHGK